MPAIRPPLSWMLPWMLVPVAFAAGVAVDAGAPRGLVVSTAEAPTRTAPSGAASVRTFTPLDPHGEAFFGLLELRPGAKVPLHEDESTELLYVLEGGGEVWIDGKRWPLKGGDAVVMPAGVPVRFEGGEAPTRVLQVFAPATSAAKYQAWSTEG